MHARGNPDIFDIGVEKGSDFMATTWTASPIKGEDVPVQVYNDVFVLPQALPVPSSSHL